MWESNGSKSIGCKPPPPKPRHEQVKKYERRLFRPLKDAGYLRTFSVIGLTRNRREFA